MKCLITVLMLIVAPYLGIAGTPGKIVFEAEDAKPVPRRTSQVDQSSFPSKRGVVLAPDQATNVDSPEAAPDLVFTVRPHQAGRHVLESHAAVNDSGRAVMSKAKTKYETLFMRISVGNAPATKRVLFVPWSPPESCRQTIGKFDLSGEEQEIKVWLPAGVILDFLEFSPYIPPKVPQEAAAYNPPIRPPDSHPRLWVNKDTLPLVKENLSLAENVPVWKKVQDDAAKPFAFDPSSSGGAPHNPALETAVVNKGFVSMMTGNAQIGKDAISLTRRYLDAVEFGNLLDITREIGRAIYAGAQVYDWCYDLMSEEDRASIRKNLMRLADDMEIGWPPFLQSVVNGHGSEAQHQCHLLSMAIAIYDEDPLPYQYCSYRILEELVPMRNFEYQSPRHNQGIGYGIYRFTWDMHAAWLMYRMSGKKIFDKNIEDVHKYWLYMRLPDGRCFPDGDGNADDRRINLGSLSLLTSAYTKDPIMKGLFLKQGGLPAEPVLTLLLNDPNLSAQNESTSLSLTMDFGKILGGMVARTGWNLNEDSSDVLVAMTGGGYNFSNHQQADAGSFQVYYKGMQIADLGQYVFYGTPYDVNFNKRSIAHSMMLAYDPLEKLPNKRLNDGGTRIGISSPTSPEALKQNPIYRNGDVVSADYGPEKDKPQFSYFSVNLASAYSSKVKDYTRTFCFLNLDNENVPAALIVLDHMQTSGSETKKYWQINTLSQPAVSSGTLKLSNRTARQPGYVTVDTLKPSRENMNLEVLSGREASSVFGHELQPPKPEAPQANGHRIMLSPKAAKDTDDFLHILTMTADTQTSLPVQFVENEALYNISIGGKTVLLSKTGKLLQTPFTFDLKSEDDRAVFIGGLKPGLWSLQNLADRSVQTVDVLDSKNTAYLNLGNGRYSMEPQQQ